MVQANKVLALQKSSKPLLVVPKKPLRPMHRFYRNCDILKSMVRAWFEIEYKKYFKKSNPKIIKWYFYIMFNKPEYCGKFDFAFSLMYFMICWWSVCQYVVSYIYISRGVILVYNPPVKTTSTKIWINLHLHRH